VERGILGRGLGESTLYTTIGDVQESKSFKPKYLGKQTLKWPDQSRCARPCALVTTYSDAHRWSGSLVPSKASVTVRWQSDKSAESNVEATFSGDQVWTCPLEKSKGQLHRL
jgi:hypothetical protein